MGIAINKSGAESVQHLDYTHKYQEEYQQSYGEFCGFSEDSNSPSTEKDMEVLKGHVHQKCFLSWDELKREYLPSG